jgi:hypothetical protein
LATNLPLLSLRHASLSQTSTWRTFASKASDISIDPRARITLTDFSKKIKVPIRLASIHNYIWLTLGAAQIVQVIEAFEGSSPGPKDCL